MARRAVGLTAAAALTGSALAVTGAAPALAAPVPPGVITGTVIGADGAPLAGVSVYARADQNGDGDYYDDEDFGDYIDTGLSGEYSFNHLPANNYILSFSAAGYQYEYYNDSNDITTATPIAVGAGPVTAATVGLVASTPSTVVDADTDITGVVTDSVTGKPIPDASVRAYNAATNLPITTTYTDVTGAYEFDSLDPAVPVKLEYYAYSGLLGYQSTWSGGGRSKATAVPVAMTPGAPVTATPVALAPLSGVTGKVLNPAGAVPYGASVSAYDADTEYASAASVRPDGTYYLTGLNPGEKYRLKFSGSDYPNNDDAADMHYYLDTWYGGSNDYTNADEFVAPAAGTFTSGIDVTFSDSLVALEKPTVTGDFVVGKPVTADPGRWSKNGGSVFTYQWMRGTTLVGSEQTYVPVSADAGKKLSLNVINTNVTAGEERTATASVSGKTVKFMPKVKAKAKAGKLTITLKTAGQKAKKVKGKVTVKQGKATVGKAKVKKGKATIVLKGKFASKGKHKFTIKFNGNKTTAGFEKKVKVKVKR